MKSDEFTRGIVAALDVVALYEEVNLFTEIVESTGTRDVLEEIKKNGSDRSKEMAARIFKGKFTKFKREQFTRINLDEKHYYYSFNTILGFDFGDQGDDKHYYRCKVSGFEICLEPCAAGFDVAIYADDDGKDAELKSSLAPKRCTETGDYMQIDALFGDRKDEDWNKALAIADEMFEKFC
jgi:hypothetical protein